MVVHKYPMHFQYKNHTCTSYIQIDELLRLSTRSEEQEEKGNEGEEKSQQQAQADQNHDRGDLELREL